MYPVPTREERDRLFAAVIAENGLTMAPGASPIPDGPRTVFELVQQRAHLGAREAVVGADGAVAYGELEGLVTKAAGALAELGVRPADRVSASLPNSVAIVVAFLASQRIGAIWVGLNQALSANEKAHILGHAGVRVLLADRVTLDSLAEKQSTLPMLTHMVEASGVAPGSQWSELVAAAAPLDPAWPQANPHHPAGIAYTSGTTGLPKGACHSQHNMLVPPAVSRARGQLGPEMRHGHPLPFTILNLMIVAPLTSMMCEATTVAMDRNSARGVLEWRARAQIDGFLVAPPTMHDLVNDESIAPNALDGVTRPGCGGADASDLLRQRFTAKFGTRFTVGYGMTEAPTAVVGEDPNLPPVPGACGIELPQVRVTARDDKGDEVPAGTEGEFCVAGTEVGDWAGVYTPMLGYWQQPEATKAALGEGFYRTGDIGYFDEGGNCHVKARRSDMILRGGSNIFPAEIENVLQRHPDVQSSVVMGRPHERLGEDVVAVIEPAPGATVEIAELVALCAGNLPKYKIPAEFFFTTTLPRNQMDKIVRKRVRKEILGLD